MLVRNTKLNICNTNWSFVVQRRPADSNDDDEWTTKLKDSDSQYLLSPYGTELGRTQIAGRRFEVSNNVPSNLTKGTGTNLSAVIYGNFADLLIGMFGQLEILVDPYTDFAKGTVVVRALQSIDIAVRHAESFAAMQDVIA